MSDIAELMGRLASNDLYFCMGGDSVAGSPEFSGNEIYFHCGGVRTRVGCSDGVSLSYIASSIHHFIRPRGIVTTWSCKDIFSVVKARTEIPMEAPASLYDLALICSYLSIDAGRPERFRDAVDVLKRCVAHPGWKDFAPFYFGVYVPLCTKVLPDIETCCLVDNSKRMCVYPHYDVEGQANGRMKAYAPTEAHYNAHSMGPEQRRNLRPSGYDDVFVSFDYRNMEVNVLQWLSGDKALGSILEGDNDPYKAIWAKITRTDATEAHRALCKNMFLPVAFGQGARSLSLKLGVKEKFAAEIIHRLVSTFPVAFDWVKTQSPNGDNMASDRFGRRRIFDGQKLHKIRNFVVQSPASMICLRKLVRLHESLSGRARICFHVHDGYSVICAKSQVNEVFELGTKVLEEEDPMFPGLKLRSACKFGNCLDQLEPINKGTPR
jgi:hypothetical protein